MHHDWPAMTMPPDTARALRRIVLLVALKFILLTLLALAALRSKGLI